MRLRHNAEELGETVRKGSVVRLDAMHQIDELSGWPTIKNSNTAVAME